MAFSDDVDIVKYEPALFGELHLPGQVLAAGTGGVASGTTFSCSGADFVAAGVSAGGVIYLEPAAGSPAGAYEIVSVDSATQLTVSVVRADSQQQAVAPPAGSDISFRISTYAPQAEQVALSLAQYFGLSGGDAASDIGAEQIIDAEGLRTASALGVISVVYAMLASESADENFWKKSLHYARSFEKARQRCRLAIDTSGDGVAESTRCGAALRLVRD